MQIVVGTDRRAKDRLRRLNRATVTRSTSTRFLVAEREGDVLGVLQCADHPHCFEMGLGQMPSMLRILGPRLVAAIRMFREVSRIHPKTPHRHLSQVAVHPAAQRQGVGAALMAAYCDSCDEDGLPGYLETIAWADATKPSAAEALRALRLRRGARVAWGRRLDGSHDEPSGHGSVQPDLTWAGHCVLVPTQGSSVRCSCFLTVPVSRARFASVAGEGVSQA